MSILHESRLILGDCRYGLRYPLRKNYQELIKDKQILEKTLISGAEKALDVSTPLINKIRKAVGIRGFTD